jgi:hypothetical protein
LSNEQPDWNTCVINILLYNLSRNAYPRNAYPHNALDATISLDTLTHIIVVYSECRFARLCPPKTDRKPGYIEDRAHCYNVDLWRQLCPETFPAL